MQTITNRVLGLRPLVSRLTSKRIKHNIRFKSEPKPDTSEKQQEKQEPVPWIPFFKIPKYAIDEKQLRIILDEIAIPLFRETTGKYIGYQTNTDLPSIEPLSKTLEMHLNNAGDPFIKSALQTDTKEIERAVLRYCAELWMDEARIEGDPENPENFWGYVLNMGSTEGNLKALWNARDYMDEDKKEDTDNDKDDVPDKPITLVDKPKPITFLSADAHYSLRKCVRILCLDKEEIPTDKYGRVQREALLTKVSEYATQKRPIIVVLNMGTTFSGAYDDHTLVDEVHQIASDNNVKCWVHMDGALGGFVAPFLERAIKEGIYFPDGLEAEHTVPHIGFDLNIQSCTASYYKWFGAPYPCGVFMTQNKYMDMHLKKVESPEYIGTPDTTLGGGRNAFTSLYIWWRLCLTCHDIEAESVTDSLSKAKFLEHQFNKIDEELKAQGKKAQLFARRAPWSFSVTFNAPPQELIKPYSIPSEKNAEFGTKRAHIYTMKHVRRQLIKTFLAELRNYHGLKTIEDE